MKKKEAKKTLSPKMVLHQPPTIHYKDSNRKLTKKIEGFVFYVLILEKGYFYKGYTSNFRRRMIEHFSKCGGCQTTRRYKPVSIYYYEVYQDKHKATMREIEMKQLGKKAEIISLAKNFKQLYVKNN